jgi:hypothetical protein
MRRIALFSLVLALGLIFVQPLQANTIYTIQANFGLYHDNSFDPLGIGSGSGTATFNFTVAPLPDSIVGGTIFSDATYQPVGLTLTLSGTNNANGTYTNLSNSWVRLENFTLSTNLYDSFTLATDLQISATKYGFFADMYLPLSFWSDSEMPPLPKLLSASDVTDLYPVGITDKTGIRPEPRYTFSNVQITCQAVPVPPTIWLLGSSLLGLAGWRRFRRG